jgi:hypothetical protein
LFTPANGAPGRSRSDTERNSLGTTFFAA